MPGPVFGGRTKLRPLIRGESCRDFRPFGEHFLDPEFVADETDVFLRQNGEDEFVVVLEPGLEVVLGHHGVLDLPSEKGFLEEVIEFDTVELAEDEYVDDAVGRRGEEVLESFRNGDEGNVLSPFEKFLDRGDRVVGLQKDVHDFLENRTGLVEMVDLLLILFP